MAGSAIAPALPSILHDFGDSTLSDLKIRMKIGVSAASTMLCSNFIGRLSDKIGYITTLKIGLSFIIFSGAAGLIINNLNQLLVTRVILGFGVAAVAISTTAWIGDQHSGVDQHRITGFLGVAMESSGLLYFSLSGALALIHWRFVFLIYLLPIFILFLLPKRSQLKKSENQNDADEKDKHLDYVIITTASFISLFGLNIYVTQLPFLFEKQNASSFSSGLALASASVSAALASYFFPRIMNYFHQQYILAIAFLISALGFMGLFLFDSLVLMSTSVIICGFAFGLTVPSLISWVNTITNENNRGAGQAKLAIAGFSGQFFSPIAFQPFVSSYNVQFGFLIFTFICVIFSSVTYMLPGQNNR